MTDMRDEHVTVQVTTRSRDGATVCRVYLLNDDNPGEGMVLPAVIPVGSTQYVLFTDIPDGSYDVVIRAYGGTISGDGYVDVPGP